MGKKKGRTEGDSGREMRNEITIIGVMQSIVEGGNRAPKNNEGQELKDDRTGSATAQKFLERRLTDARHAKA